MENNLVAPQKVKYGIIIWSSNSIPKTIENKNWNRYLYIHVYSSIIQNRQKVETTQAPSTDEYINKIWYVYVKYYTIIKRNEVLVHATTWVNFEDIVLNELGHGVTIMWFHLYEVSRIGKFIGTETRLRLPGFRVSVSYCFMGRVSVWGNKKVLDMDSGCIIL